MNLHNCSLSKYSTTLELSDVEVDVDVMFYYYHGVPRTLYDPEEPPEINIQYVVTCGESGVDIFNELTDAQVNALLEEVMINADLEVTDER